MMAGGGVGEGGEGGGEGVGWEARRGEEGGGAGCAGWRERLAALCGLWRLTERETCARKAC